MPSEGDQKSKVAMRSKSLIKAVNMSVGRLRGRKQSYGFGRVSAIRLMPDRGSQYGIDYRRPPLIFANTYQLDSHYRFHVEQVTNIVDIVLYEIFEDHEYNVEESPLATMRIASEVTHTCKTMGFNRYRIICVVTIGQKRAQSYNNAITFLWDQERDLYVDVVKETFTAFVQVTVFGIYLD